MIQEINLSLEKNMNAYMQQKLEKQQNMAMSIEYSSFGENKPQITDQIFQINTLALNKQNQIQQKTLKSLQNFIISTDVQTRKVEKRNINQKNQRSKKLCPLEMIYQPYFSFLAKTHEQPKQGRFFEYVNRRNSKNQFEEVGKTDLGVYNLKEIVEFCVGKMIISSSVYIQFTYDSIQHDESSFVDKLNRKKVEYSVFQKLYFTPLDHRLLSKILSQQFPQQFKFPNKPLMQNPKLTKFYSFLYDLPQQEYSKMCAILNHKFCRIWMPNNLSSFSDIVREKVLKIPQSSQQQSFPFHLPLRKLRKKY